MDADDEARTTGRRVRQIRHTRGQSLRVISGLAGISKSHLSRIERGERALDSRSEIVSLANALQIAPSELTGLPVPAPGNGKAGKGNSEAAIGEVRQALNAITRNRADGQVLPVEVLRVRVGELLVGVGRLRSAPRCLR
jgi:transcriptional regulator with XRE-family HTH domain